MKRQKTQEEKIAEQLSKIVADVRLDLDLVGIYLAKLAPNVSTMRLQIIAEAMDYEKEKMNDRANFTYTLFE
jgi:hypothetical protein